MLEPDGRVPNVGPVGAGVRVVLGLATLAATAAALRALGPDWAVPVAIHGLVTAAWLLLGAATRFDPFLGALGLPWRPSARPPPGGGQRSRARPRHGHAPP